jgi:hypothetical protein
MMPKRNVNVKGKQGKQRGRKGIVAETMFLCAGVTTQKMAAKDLFPVYRRLSAPDEDKIPAVMAGVSDHTVLGRLLGAARHGFLDLPD